MRKEETTVRVICGTKEKEGTITGKKENQAG